MAIRKEAHCSSLLVLSPSADNAIIWSKWWKWCLMYTYTSSDSVNISDQLLKPPLWSPISYLIKRPLSSRKEIPRAQQMIISSLLTDLLGNMFAAWKIARKTKSTSSIALCDVGFMSWTVGVSLLFSSRPEQTYERETRDGWYYTEGAIKSTVSSPNTTLDVETVCKSDRHFMTALIYGEACVLLCIRISLSDYEYWIVVSH